MELTTEDRQRIEQEINRIWFRTDTADRNPIELLKEIAEYATRYERNWVTHLQERVRVLAAKCEELEAERTELIRGIKSILKASTVHDKISILEELEQLLNSLKK